MKKNSKKSHMGLVWLVLVLGLTNLAIFLEASQNQAITEPVALAAEVETLANSGSVAGHVASISVTIGSGLIILGAAVIWVSNFVRDLKNTPESAKVARKSSAKPTRATSSIKAATKNKTKSAAGTVKADTRKTAHAIKKDLKVAKAGTKSTKRTAKATAKKSK